MSEPLLRLDELKTHFFTDDGVVRAVDGVSYALGERETLAVVGESGSGKSVTALSILRLVADPPGRIVSESSVLADMKPLEKPKAGCTAVARVTRSLTVTTKASPSRSTEPAKISRLLGPTRGNPHADTIATAAKRATDFAQREESDFTARSPRTVIIRSRFGNRA